MNDKSLRNKTLELTDGEYEKYLSNCVKVDENFRFESNKTLLGDTFKTLDLLPDSFCDLAIVDPPYNLTKDFHGNKFTETGYDEYKKYTELWLDKLIRLLKPNASIYVCCDWKSSVVIGEVLLKKLKVRNRITWEREKGRGAEKNWKNSMEDIWFATVSDDYTFNLDAVKVRKKVIAPYMQDGKPKDWKEENGEKFRFTCPSNFWDDISVPYWSMPENTEHPTQKPEKLIAKLILASSNVGDVVFDPFLGSGTTSVTAKKLNRNYLGIEQNPTYCAWAEKRLDIAENDKRIQGFTDGVFLERNARNIKRT